MKILPIILSFLLFLPLFFLLASCGNSPSPPEEESEEQDVSAVPERSPLPRSSPLPPIDIDAVIDAILTGRVYSADDLFLMRRHIASFTKAPEDGGNILTIRKLTDPETVIVTLVTHTPETVSAFFEEFFPGIDPETIPVEVYEMEDHPHSLPDLNGISEEYRIPSNEITPSPPLPSAGIDAILKQTEYSYNDLRAIQGHIVSYMNSTDDGGNISTTSIRDSKRLVVVILTNYTPDNVAAFFEEVFPGYDQESLPVTVEQEVYGIPR